MKLPKILLLAFSLSLLPLFFTGCCWFETCGCGNSISERYFKVRGWASANVLIDSTVNNGYVNVSLDSLTKMGAFPYYRIGINLKVIGEYYSYTSLYNYGSLMACDPKPNGYDGSKEKITSIQIISNNDFDTEHPAGANLADVFHIKEMDWYNSWSTSPALDLQTYVDSNPSPGMYYILWLKKAPTSVHKHTFSIIYEQTDGKKYIVTANEISFL